MPGGFFPRCGRGRRDFSRSPGTGGRELGTGGPPELTSWSQRISLLQNGVGAQEDALVEVGRRKPPCCIEVGRASPGRGWGWVWANPNPYSYPHPTALSRRELQPAPTLSSRPQPRPRPCVTAPAPPPRRGLPGGVTPPRAPGSGGRGGRGWQAVFSAGRGRAGAEGGVPTAPALRPVSVMSQSRPAPASQGRFGAVGCEAASAAGRGSRVMACPRPLPHHAAPRAGPPRQG